MRLFPAVDVTWLTLPPEDQIERLLAEIDAERPTAVEERPDGVRVFFATADARERGRLRLAAADPSAECRPIDVPDENWAERSQQSLAPISVGRIVVVTPTAPLVRSTSEQIVIVINPSMGFGTGHHASTRRCLALLQETNVIGGRVLDVGTGSGVLAIAAWRCGATHIVAADNDPDALQSAAENIALNEANEAVSVRLWDLEKPDDPDQTPFDLVTANLTGALLERSAPGIAHLVRPGGHLILSGLQEHEEPAVVAAFAAVGARLSKRSEEEGWLGLLLTIDVSSSPTSSRVPSAPR